MIEKKSWLNEVKCIYAYRGSKRAISKEWSTNEEVWFTYEEALKKHKQYNIGLLAGKVNKIMILDIDNPKVLYQALKKNGYNKNYESFIKELETVATVKTRKGYHIYLKYIPGLTNKGAMYLNYNGEHIGELRYQNVMAIIPPSIITYSKTNKLTGEKVAFTHKYEWLNKQIYSFNNIPSFISSILFLFKVFHPFIIHDRNKNKEKNGKNLISEFFEKKPGDNLRTAIESDYGKNTFKNFGRKNSTETGTKTGTQPEHFTQKPEHNRNTYKISEGNRNNIMYVFANVLKRNGITSEERLLKLILAIDKAINDPPLQSQPEELRKLKEMIPRVIRNDYGEDRVTLSSRIIEVLRKRGVLQLKDIAKELEIYANSEVIRKTLYRLVQREIVKKLERGFYAVETEVSNSLDDFWNVKDIIESYIFDEVIEMRLNNTVLIGGKSGHGKTHLAVNFAKILVENGKKVLYIYTEFGAVAPVVRKLGITSAYKDKVLFVSHIDFEKLKLNIDKYSDYVWIYDWLTVPDGEYYRFEQLIREFTLDYKAYYKIIFTQLKKRSGDFYSPDSIDFYAALALKMFKDSDNVGHFEIVKNRFSKNGYIEGTKFSYVYDPDTGKIEFIFDRTK